MTSIALLIGIGIMAPVITLFFIFMFETVTKNGEGREGPKLSNPAKQFLKIETVADGLTRPTSMEFIDNENILLMQQH